MKQITNRTAWRVGYAAVQSSVARLLRILLIVLIFLPSLMVRSTPGQAAEVEDQPQTQVFERQPETTVTAPQIDCPADETVWVSIPPAIAKGTAPDGVPRVLVYVNHEPFTYVNVYSGSWQVALPLSEHITSTIYAVSVDAIGNFDEDLISNICTMGLTGDGDPLTDPKPSISDNMIGINATVVMTATT